MRGTIPPLSQYVFMTWRLVKTTGQTLPLPLLRNQGSNFAHQ